MTEKWKNIFEMFVHVGGTAFMAILILGIVMAVQFAISLFLINIITGWAGVVITPWNYVIAAILAIIPKSFSINMGKGSK